MEKMNISFAKYLANDAVSRSELFEMKKSPLHYKYAKENPSAETAAFAFGTAFHTLVLEPERFKKEYAVMPGVDRRTKEGKRILAELSESRKNYISSEDFEAITQMAENVTKNKYAAALLAGEHEISYFWTDEFTGIDLKCRADARKDLKTTSVIVDLKTCQSADTETFMRECFKYGYDLQAAMYSEGVSKVTGKPHKFIFIAVEKSVPYAVNILEADELFIRKGMDDFRLYLGMLKECRTTGNWYDYTGSKGIPNTLGLPVWLAKEYE